MLKLNNTVLVVFLLVVGSAVPAWSVSVGEPAPDFTLATLEDKAIGLADFKGKKPLMLVFWATWCPICKEEVPEVNKIAEEFGPKGLSVIGINVGINDSPRRAERYRDKYKVNFPLAFDHESMVSRSFGVAGTPTILILDKQGIVRYRDAAVPEDLKDHFAKLME